MATYKNESSLNNDQRNNNSRRALYLGEFEETSIRVLRGTLGPEYDLVGESQRIRALRNSNEGGGGFGGGSMNHWFRVKLASPAWIMMIKMGVAMEGHNDYDADDNLTTRRELGQKNDFIQLSAFDLNRAPIEGRPIFQAEAIATPQGKRFFYPYFGTVAGAASDLYNTGAFDQYRFDKGDDMFFPLEAGEYLLVVSSTLSNKCKYAVGLVIEFPPTEISFLQEQGFPDFIVQENAVTRDQVRVIQPVESGDFTITNTELAITPPPGETALITPAEATIEVGGAWITNQPAVDFDERDGFFRIICDFTEGAIDSFHDHSLSDWRKAWAREGRNTPLPVVFEQFTNVD